MLGDCCRRGNGCLQYFFFLVMAFLSYVCIYMPWLHGNLSPINASNGTSGARDAPEALKGCYIIIGGSGLEIVNALILQLGFGTTSAVILSIWCILQVLILLATYAGGIYYFVNHGTRKIYIFIVLFFKLYDGFLVLRMLKLRKDFIQANAEDHNDHEIHLDTEVKGKAITATSAISVASQQSKQQDQQVKDLEATLALGSKVDVGNMKSQSVASRKEKEK